ncbi:MAG: DUF4430 domain-containing protein [Candidatus Saccharibacteria bacterium]
MKKRIILYIIGALVLISGISATAYYFKSNENKQSKTDNIVKTEAKEISYKGKDGVNALELLKQNAKVDASPEGMVNSINGVSADSAKKEFWSFNVDGKPANEGAGTYITKGSETITWKIDTF